jgi:hypothetical protein
MATHRASTLALCDATVRVEDERVVEAVDPGSDLGPARLA